MMISLKVEMSPLAIMDRKVVRNMDQNLTSRRSPNKGLLFFEMGVEDTGVLSTQTGYGDVALTIGEALVTDGVREKDSTRRRRKRL